MQSVPSQKTPETLYGESVLFILFDASLVWLWEFAERGIWLFVTSKLGVLVGEGDL